MSPCWSGARFNQANIRIGAVWAICILTDLMWEIVIDMVRGWRKWFRAYLNPNWVRLLVYICYCLKLLLCVNFKVGRRRQNKNKCGIARKGVFKCHFRRRIRIARLQKPW